LKAKPYRPTTHGEAMVALQEDERKRIEARVAAEVRELRALRAIRLSCRAIRADLRRRLGLAAAPAAGRERGGLARLVHDVQALGGEVDLVVRLGGREPIRVVRVGGDFAFGPYDGR